MSEASSELKEVEAIQKVAAALAYLEPEERGRVLAWANAKYGGAAVQNVQPTQHAQHVQQQKHGTPPQEKASETGEGSKVSKTSKKVKTVLKIDKTMDLSPAGKQSADAFAKAKAPSNAKQKGLVAAYWVKEVLGLEKVTAEQVGAYFKGVGWALPADLKNVLQQAGTEGWLDTKDSQNILITSAGETMVEHKLPAAQKAA